MTAMPPTTGHLQLMQFADQLSPEGVVVIACTQPHEPMAEERIAALRAAIRHQGMQTVRLEHLDASLEQDPASPGFWEMWRDLLHGFGVTAGDYIVSSELYGRKLAEITGAEFFPYDIDRSLNAVKATLVREDPEAHFADILPEFQQHLRTTVTIFGAESTGKTTLSRRLAQEVNGHWLFEYARPYLETTVNEITPRSMRAIWRGQAALQRHARNLHDRPFVIQDTDLFSTVGYWQFPAWQDVLGPCPENLRVEARALQSDLYLVTRQNIPFEPDPLRYGGDTREGSDDYWTDVCEQYALPYLVLESSDREVRLTEAVTAARRTARRRTERIAYDRRGL